MTIHWKAVEQYFTPVLFVFPFYPVCNFGKFIILDLALSGVSGLMRTSMQGFSSNTFFGITVFDPGPENAPSIPVIDEKLMVIPRYHEKIKIFYSPGQASSRKI